MLKAPTFMITRVDTRGHYDMFIMKRMDIPIPEIEKKFTPDDQERVYTSPSIIELTEMAARELIKKGD